MALPVAPPVAGARGWDPTLNAIINSLSGQIDTLKATVDSLVAGGGGYVDPNAGSSPYNLALATVRTTFGWDNATGADNAPAINRALDAFCANPVGPVILPGGLIRASNIRVDPSKFAAQGNGGGPPYGFPGIRLYGQGEGVTRIQQSNGATGDLMTIAGRLGTDAGAGNNGKIAGAEIYGFDLIGNGTTGGSGLVLQSILNSTVRNIRSIGFKGDGFLFKRGYFVGGVSDEFFYQNYFYNLKALTCNGWAFNTDGANALSYTMVACEGQACIAGGIRTNPSNVEIINCTMQGCGTADVNGRGFLSIRNSNTGSLNFGLRLVGFRSESCAITGGYAIEIQGIRSARIIDATVFSNSAVAPTAIGIGLANTAAIEQQARNVSVTGGTFNLAQASNPGQFGVVTGPSAQDTFGDLQWSAVNGSVAVPLSAFWQDGGLRTTFPTLQSYSAASGGSTPTPPPQTGSNAFLAQANGVGTTPACWFIGGDSISTGSDLAKFDLRNSEGVQDNFNQRANGGAGVLASDGTLVTNRYIPAYYVGELSGFSPLNQGWSWNGIALTGAAAKISSVHGFGRQAVQLGTAGSGSITQSYSSATFYFFTATADSATVTFTNGAGVVTTSTIATGTAGTRSFTVTGDLSPTSISVAGVSGNAYFKGAEFQYGTETKGLRLIDGSRHGSMEWQFIVSRGGNQGWTEDLPTAAITGLWLMRGTNDDKNSNKDGSGVLMTATSFQQSVQAEVDYWRGVYGPTFPILLISMWTPPGAVTFPWADLIAANTSVAAGSAYTWHCNLNALIPDRTGLTTSGDPIHPNAAGHAAIRDAITAFILAA